MQGTLLPLQLATATDYTTDLWFDGDRRDLYFGPVRMFGEGLDQREPVLRLDAAVEISGAQHMQLVVGERTRVAQIADICVASMMQASPVETGTAFRAPFGSRPPKTIYAISILRPDRGSPPSITSGQSMKPKFRPLTWRDSGRSRWWKWTTRCSAAGAARRRHISTKAASSTRSTSRRDDT
jgi:hypothetical protein